MSSLDGRRRSGGAGLFRKSKKDGRRVLENGSKEGGQEAGMAKCGQGGMFSMGATLNQEQVRLLDLRFSKYIERTADLRPVFMQIGEEYQKEVRKQFETEGAYGGQPWVGLSRLTIEARKRKGFAAGPILVMTSDLKDSLTKRTSQTINVITPRMWVYGTSVRYGIFHQSRSPRRKIPRRAFLIVTAKFRLMVVRAMHRFIAEEEKGIIGRLLRGL